MKFLKRIFGLPTITKSQKQKSVGIEASGEFDGISNGNPQSLCLNETGCIALIANDLDYPKCPTEEMGDSGHSSWIKKPSGMEICAWHTIPKCSVKILDTRKGRVIHSYNLIFSPSVIELSADGKYAMAMGMWIEEEMDRDRYAKAMEREMKMGIEMEMANERVRDRKCEGAFLLDTFTGEKIGEIEVKTARQALTFGPFWGISGSNLWIKKPSVPEVRCLYKNIAGKILESKRLKISENFSFRNFELDFPVTDSLVCTVCINPERNLALSGHESGDVYLWEIQTARRLGILKGHKGPVTHACFSGDSKCALTAGQDKRVLFWRLKKCMKI